ncbi:MAG: glutamine amidotransferase [Syntrophomonadaceae bacterium]|nr:glutamine amidotransferase [Syntrophomonadaceae bacterium]
MADFTIAHMYPDLLNLYGDRGNLLCLQKRLEWYGHGCVIKDISLGENLDYTGIDMIFMGGGSDREQGLVYQDLADKADRLKAEIRAGLPVLCICGAYQLLGMYYRSHDGKIMQGLGFFNFYTQGKKRRLIGNILVQSTVAGRPVTVVGFENHGGRTYFQDDGLQPFGKVIKGYGNNGEDGTEGVTYKNLVGTYLHGPLLPKNPAVADFFIQAMCSRKGVTNDKTLDDSIENFAHEQVKEKLLGKSAVQAGCSMKKITGCVRRPVGLL